MPTNFQHRLQVLGYSSYQAYLTSPRWEDVRQRYRMSSLPKRCVNCRSPKYQLHHSTYERLGNEELADLVPLCAGCHKLLHRLLPLAEGKVPLAQAHIALQATTGACRPPAGVPTFQLTKANSTKKERKRFAKRRRAQRKAITVERQGRPGQVLIDCACGRRAWQDGPYCALCGSLANIIRSNNP
jgi:hypothetical protein